MKFLKKTVTAQIIICMLICVFGFSASAKNSDDVFFSAPNTDKKIALTFDDGPHPRLTPRILDILDKYGIKATFFVIGVNAKEYPSALKRIADAGHEIANHTYSHVHLSQKNVGKIERELINCESEILDKTNIKTSLFRPPEGQMCNDLRFITQKLNYKVILWSIDTRDWAHTPPQQIAKKVEDNIKGGDIILMHDFIGHNSPTPEALEIFIPRLLEQGFKFVTVSELIG